MTKLSITTKAPDDERVFQELSKFVRRIEATPPGTCPLTVQLTLLQTGAAQTCGKCVPCRDGLPRLAALLEQVVSCEADASALDELRALAEMIRDTSDYAIGLGAATAVLEGMNTVAAE